MRNNELLTIFDTITTLELNGELKEREKELNNKFLALEKRLESLEDRNILEEIKEISDLTASLNTDTELFYLNMGLTLGRLKGSEANAE